MATWVIGDVQGCFEALERLLARIDFDPARDRVWLAGDLVNRGPGSLSVLRWAAREAAVDAVLGNHDLYLLARAEGVAEVGRGDTLDALLEAPDRDALLAWLAARPLAASVADHLLVHAGLPPAWTADEALTHAASAHAWLKTPGALRATWRRPDAEAWRADLDATERGRFTVGALTRLRVCTPAGRLRLDFKGPPSEAPTGTVPWFEVPGRASAGASIVFGHWAHLGLHLDDDAGVYGLDTGCVYGGSLTAMRLEDHRVEQVRGWGDRR